MCLNLNFYLYIILHYKWFSSVFENFSRTPPQWCGGATPQCYILDKRSSIPFKWHPYCWGRAFEILVNFDLDLRDLRGHTTGHAMRYDL